MYIITAINILVSVLFRAFTIGTLWFWYITSIFDVDPLTMPQAFGLGVFISFLTYKRNSRMEDAWNAENKQSTSDEFAHGLVFLINVVFVNAFTLLMGWLGTLFM